MYLEDVRRSQYDLQLFCPEEYALNLLYAGEAGFIHPGVIPQSKTKSRCTVNGFRHIADASGQLNQTYSQLPRGAARLLRGHYILLRAGTFLGH
ncbi:hypothetical protein D3C81_993590 [compost metagenome]